jgi:hypothetical protein
MTMGMGGPRGGGNGGGAGGAMAGLSEADRQKMRAAIQKALNGRSMQELSAEERTKLMADVSKQTGISRPAGGANRTAPAEGAEAGASGGEYRGHVRRRNEVPRGEVREEGDAQGLLLRLISGSSIHGVSLFSPRTVLALERAEEEE